MTSAQTWLITALGAVVLLILIRIVLAVIARTESHNRLQRWKAPRAKE